MSQDLGDNGRITNHRYSPNRPKAILLCTEAPSAAVMAAFSWNMSPKSAEREVSHEACDATVSFGHVVSPVPFDEDNFLLGKAESGGSLTIE